MNEYHKQDATKDRKLKMCGRVFCLFCVLLVSLLAVYYYYGLLEGSYIPKMTLDNDEGIKLLDNLANKQNTRANFDDSERAMTVTPTVLREDKAITEGILSSEDSIHASKIKSGTKPKLVQTHLPITIKSTVKFIEQSNAFKSNFSKRVSLHTEQLLRDSIYLHHKKNFIKPQNETCKRRRPICILIGVYKCGTRELVDFLRLHPHIEIYPTSLRVYEMPYFSRMYEKGENWFKRQLPCIYSNQITFIKNAGYFHDTAVPERIKQFNESLKLILMVREPVARTLSQYMFKESRGQLCKGYTGENVPKNFSSCTLSEDGSAVNTSSFIVRHSVYDKPMNLWLQYFNLSQFLIIESEELKHDPASVLTKIERFLGLGHYITHDMFVFNKEKGFYCIQSNLTDTGMACYPQNRGKKEQIAVPQRTISKLKEYFEPKNKRFFKIIGRSFDWKYTAASL